MAIRLYLNDIIIPISFSNTQYKMFYESNQAAFKSFIDNNTDDIIAAAGGLSNMVVGYEWIDDDKVDDILDVEEQEIDEYIDQEEKIKQLEKEIKELRAQKTSASNLILCKNCKEFTEHALNICQVCLHTD